VANLNELRKDGEFLDDLNDIIEVFKSSAALQFTALSKRRAYLADYAENMKAAAATVQRQLSRTQAFTAGGKEVLYLAITSDEGFLGELNTAVVNKVIDQVRQVSARVYIVGSRGVNYLEDADIAHRLFASPDMDAIFASAREMADEMCRVYWESGSAIRVIYPHFISVGAQKVIDEVLLPFARQETGAEREVLVEPDAGAVALTMSRMWLAYRLADILFDSKLAELSARMMHLEGSSQELTEMKIVTKRRFFKESRANNDKSIREISAAKMLVKR